MLQIEIDNGSGFCFGVTTAISKAEEELAEERRYIALVISCITAWNVSA